MIPPALRYEHAWEVGADPEEAYFDPGYYITEVAPLLGLPEEVLHRMAAVKMAAKFLGSLGPVAGETAQEMAQRVIELADRIYREIYRVPRSVELATMPYGDYLQTPEWNNRRRAAYERAQNRCQICNRPGPLQAHHRTFERRRNEAPEDLVALCDQCHSLFHRYLGLATDQPTTGGPG